MVSFGTPLQQQHGSTTLGAVMHDAASSFFQLEELEDRSSCVTEIFLNTDKTVNVFETDSPIPSESWGTWEQWGDFFALNFQKHSGQAARAQMWISFPIPWNGLFSAK
jgi:hypothetical protein